MLIYKRDWSLLLSKQVLTPSPGLTFYLLQILNFPTSLLFFLSNSQSSQMLQLFPKNWLQWLHWVLEVEVRIPPASRQALEVILRGSATLCLEKRIRKWRGDMFPLAAHCSVNALFFAWFWPLFSDNKGFQSNKTGCMPLCALQESQSWSQSNLAVAVLDGTSRSQNGSSSNFVESPQRGSGFGVSASWYVVV